MQFLVSLIYRVLKQMRKYSMIHSWETSRLPQCGFNVTRLNSHSFKSHSCFRQQCSAVAVGVGAGGGAVYYKYN